MRACLLLACLCSFAAHAQERDIQRALMQRQQQSDEFALQLGQSQQRLQVVPGDLNQAQSLEARQLQERQRLESLDARQQRSLGQDGSGRFGAERLHADRDRQMELQRPYEFRLPPPAIREPITPRPKDPEPY